MGSLKRVLITITILIAVIVLLFFISNSITRFIGFLITEEGITQEDTKFINCLQDQSIVLYINEENSENTLNSLSLKEYLPYFEIMNCFDNHDLCSENSISNFPVWIIKNQKIEKDITLNELSQLTGC